MPFDTEPILADIIGRLSVIQTYFAAQDELLVSPQESRGLAVILRETIDQLVTIQAFLTNGSKAPIS